MWMDRIRTPYTRFACLDPGCTYIVELRWYPAPSGAKAFPAWHLFSSGDWCEQAFWQSWPGPGELKDAKRTFYNGEGPRQTYTGQGFEGQLEWFQQGVPLDVIMDALANPPPRTCATTSWVPPQGGILLGGYSATIAPPPPYASQGGILLGGSTEELHDTYVPYESQGGLLLGGFSGFGFMNVRPCDAYCCGFAGESETDMHILFQDTTGSCSPCMEGFTKDLAWLSGTTWQTSEPFLPPCIIPPIELVFITVLCESNGSGGYQWRLIFGDDPGTIFDGDLSSCNPLRLVFHVTAPSAVCPTGGTYTAIVTFP